MMQESLAPISNTTSDMMLKPGQPEFQMNSQGERIEMPQQAPLEAIKEPLHTLGDQFEDVIALGDTALAIAADALWDATDDTGMEHKIISCGHVLKSTHDLARWSEKTGARRVNQQDSIDAVTDLAINLEPRRPTNNNKANSSAGMESDLRGLFNEPGSRKGRGRVGGKRNLNKSWKPVDGQKSEVINCWPVLKSTHDQAQLSEKRGRRAVNQAGASGALEELALNGGQAGERSSSQIVNSWSVLKSTHDQAQWSEKKGANAVNDASAGQMLEELVQNVQAGGSSLQSGLDTQAATHVQLEGQ